MSTEEQDRIEELEKKLGRMEELLEKVTEKLGAFLESPVEPPSLSLERYRLNDNEQHVLSLIALGISDAGAGRAFGLSDGYVGDRLRDSLRFSMAYREIKDTVRNWMEARVAFTLPMAYARIDQILAADPEEYLVGPEEGGRINDSNFARAILQSQSRLAETMVRASMIDKERKVVHELNTTQPIFQVSKENLDIIADKINALRLEETKGTLKGRIEDVIDVEPIDPQ